MNELAIATQALVHGTSGFEELVSQLTDVERQALEQVHDLIERDPRELAKLLAAKKDEDPWTAISDR